jgi:hypothetical protein
MFYDMIVCLFVYDLMMMNFMYRYACTKTFKEADIHKLGRPPRGEFVCLSTKELAKSTSYSVRVWRGRCDDSALSLAQCSSDDDEL